MKLSENKSRALLVTLSPEGADFRLSLDDLVLRDAQSATWQKEVHYTSKVLNEKDFEKFNFDEKELADFGYAILARLNAFREC